MTYFKDLSRYGYSKFLTYPSSAELSNVGWLDHSEPYERGRVDSELVAKLLLLCKCPLNMYRGWHGCQFCSVCPVKITDSDGEFCLGDAEIRVWARSGKTYAAPNLIYHYVAVHEYRPPDEFLNALREMIMPYPRILQAREALDQFRRDRSSVQLLTHILVSIAGRDKQPVPAEVRKALLQAGTDLKQSSGSAGVEVVVANLESLLNGYHTVPE